MAERTITRADLCEAVYKKTGLSRIESASLVETVLKEITDCLERGETVKLSSFGTFVVRKKGQRIGRNPKTGTEVPISPRRVMVFKPSAILKQHIKTGPAGINADVPMPSSHLPSSASQSKVAGSQAHPWLQPAVSGESACDMGDLRVSG
jgi:integration host factor subunit alpha